METLNFNTQICTTIEQSKRLLELGLKPETSDMHYVRKTTDAMGNNIDADFKEPRYGNTLSKYAKYGVMNFSNYETLPAWSLHRLFAMVCNYPCKDHFIFDFSMDYDSMEDVYDSVIEVIESHIKENNFNKDYLK